VLVDDLVVECPREPYRMFTSRAEYRLLLRSDNADMRLMELGHGLGLISAEDLSRLERKRSLVEGTLAYLESCHHEGKDLLRILRRPETSLQDLFRLDPVLAAKGLDSSVQQAVEIEAKYAAYVVRQQAQVEKFKRMERRLIPTDLDYSRLRGIRGESREKLAKVLPRSLGQASRISGVTPADLNILLVYLDSPARKLAQEEALS
jgi:tRNA uridine 5-carboxymethylaminomethyl modification enzyme